MRLPEAVLKRLERHPIVKQIEAELAADQVAERVRVAAEIKQLRQQEAKDTPPLQAATTKALAERSKRWLAYLEAASQVEECERRESSLSFTVQRGVNEREARLRELASPDIQATIHQLEAEFEGTRHGGDLTRERARAYPVARDALRVLQLDAGADVPARIAEILAAIPA